MRSDLRRIDPAVNARRFYRLRLCADLFGGVVLLRAWGRIGTRGRGKTEAFSSLDTATEALERLHRHKLRRGYREETQGESGLSASDVDTPS